MVQMFFYPNIFLNIVCLFDLIMFQNDLRVESINMQVWVVTILTINSTKKSRNLLKYEEVYFGFYVTEEWWERMERELWGNVPLEFF